MVADESADATRRTRLANERTYLAWWRTGLTAIAVSIGFGKIVPGVSDVAHWPFTLAGVVFALVGAAIIGYGHYRFSGIERSLDRGEFWRADPRALAVLSACGVALGLLTLVLVLATS